MKTTTWYYRLSSGPDKEWAEVVITSTGMFAAVSDWGNYAYAWRCTGCKDVREFFARIPVDTDYFARKFAGSQREYDAEHTLKAVQEHIKELQENGDLTEETITEELDNLRYEYSNLENEFYFNSWVNDGDNRISEPWELYRCNLPTQIVQFCERILPRLAEKIQDELELEQALGGSSQAFHCTIPPEGWYCTREPRHEGPCAAYPKRLLPWPNPPAEFIRRVELLLLGALESRVTSPEVLEIDWAKRFAPEAVRMLFDGHTTDTNV
jgi:hypothetical protein